MFIGRKEELEDLETLWRKRTSSIVACRGRRRIGKTTLFREFARRTADAHIEIEGLPPQKEKRVSNQDQINHFIEVLAGQTGCDASRVDNWYAAFARLEHQIDDSKKTVILLDEISWMAADDPNFPGRLRTAYIIEVKRKRFIGAEVEREVEEKIRRIPLHKGLSPRPVLVYDGELDPEVEGRGYFDAILPARKLLEA